MAWHLQRASAWRKILGSLSLLGVLTLGGCASEPAGPPMPQLTDPTQLYPGESASLRERVSGVLVVAQPPGGVLLVDLSAPKRHWLRPADRPLAVWDMTVAGQTGAVAVLTSASSERSYRVQLLTQDGQTDVMQGPGDALWDKPITGLALAPQGNALAWVQQPIPGLQFKPLRVGPLYWRNLNESQSRMLVAEVLGERPSWFPDGRRLAYSVAGPNASENYAQLDPAAQVDPEVRILDTVDGSSQRLTAGRLPLVSSDGQSVLVTRGKDFGLFLVDLRTGTERRVVRMHGLGTPLALMQSRYLVYTGKPTPGAPTGQSVNNSPLVGPKAMLAVKVLDIQTKEFVTILEGVDPRRRLAVGEKSLH